MAAAEQPTGPDPLAVDGGQSTEVAQVGRGNEHPGVGGHDRRPYAEIHTPGRVRGERMWPLTGRLGDDVNSPPGGTPSWPRPSSLKHYGRRSGVAGREPVT